MVHHLRQPRFSTIPHRGTLCHRSDGRVLNATFHPQFLSLLYALFLCDTTHCSINRFRRAARLARPSPGGEKRTAVWASRHEVLVSNDVVSPPVCDPMVVPHGWAVRDRGNPSGSAGDACLDAAAQARRAARAVDGGVVSVPQALSVSPSTPPLHAQRVAQFAHYCTRNSLPPQK
jgi:hypothetical protein